VNISNFLNTLGDRLIKNYRTSVGGGIAGMIFAIFIGKLEEMSGCHFATAFANVDWGQLAGYLFGQAFGLIVTDSHKTVSTSTAPPTAPTT